MYDKMAGRDTRESLNLNPKMLILKTRSYIVNVEARRAGPQAILENMQEAV